MATTDTRAGAQAPRRGRPQGHGPGFEARRAEVVDIATTLFAERGYSGTSVSDLTAATGMGKGALYRYIESKENLLVEISARVMGPLVERTHEVCALDESPLVKLRLISEAILAGIAERPDSVWVYEHDYRYLTGTNRTRFLAQRSAFEEPLLELGRDAVARGLFRDTDVRLLMFQFFNLHKQVAQWFHRGGGWSPEELSREYCRTLFNGFAADSTDFADVERRVANLRH
ncbi:MULTISPECIES: TetR/AcrR family transcriptional regulator [Pseudonocardia]|uniref:HTH-type transcriptional repressor KstR2 n=2 Tax=Pseudonocardia TaxID=1847 RepID=A0A1Y2N5I7_PSEAH|nr:MULTISPECIES: TetR/AcrR family transcriptional regulator [Pseudonocardia]OSY42725.1 HTH-type transcriptional repressor KstR2 [Pseudonocardia autotrophica]TDN77302.1 TetR family transcriptional regulator [Pseudonocardia autotrophica]BBG01324.1 TetR family transcriptional regulator [Pseudonocardia autotrophica]GEC24380.1 TetR family transcriptional regulator [Pseudonocardia saturnea]